MMKVVKESHVDHALTDAQVGYLAELFKDRGAFFVETVELPDGDIPCALHGPIMGDAPVPEAEGPLGRALVGVALEPAGDE